MVARVRGAPPHQTFINGLPIYQKYVYEDAKEIMGLNIKNWDFFYLQSISSMIFFLSDFVAPRWILVSSFRYAKQPSRELVVFGIVSPGYFC